MTTVAIGGSGGIQFLEFVLNQNMTILTFNRMVRHMIVSHKPNVIIFRKFVFFKTLLLKCPDLRFGFANQLFRDP